MGIEPAWSSLARRCLTVRPPSHESRPRGESNARSPGLQPGALPLCYGAGRGEGESRTLGAPREPGDLANRYGKPTAVSSPKLEDGRGIEPPVPLSTHARFRGERACQVPNPSGRGERRIRTFGSPWDLRFSRPARSASPPLPRCGSPRNRTSLAGFGGQPDPRSQPKTCGPGRNCPGSLLIANQALS